MNIEVLFFNICCCFLPRVPYRAQILHFSSNSPQILHLSVVFSGDTSAWELLSINGANADYEFKNTLKKAKVGHFDCSEMDTNKMYSLNKIAPCDIETEKIKVSEATATIMQRIYKTK